MAQSYQKGINTGAEANHPAQKPNVTADQGITERANERPDIASNKDTSSHTDTGGNPNVPPNPEEVKAETGDHQKQQEKKDPESVDPDDEDDAPPPPPGTEYPEQKHAGKVGYGPAYADTHGAVHMSERIDGIKKEIKGKILRKPELVQQGRDEKSGEAKRKQQEKESQPNAGPKPAGDGPKSESKDDANKEGKVAKGAQGDKPVAQAAQEGAEKDNKTDEPAAKEAQAKSQESERSSESTQRRQPEDISEKEGTTNAERKESIPSSQDSSNQGQQTPNPPAPHSNRQGDEHNSSYGTQNKGSSYQADENAKPNPPAPFKDQSTDQEVSRSGVNTSPPKGHEGNSE